MMARVTMTRTKADTSGFLVCLTVPSIVPVVCCLALLCCLFADLASVALGYGTMNLV